MATEVLIDRPPEKFIDHLLMKHPAPKGPDYLNLETGEVVVGEKLWEKGIRLQGNQRRLMTDPWRFQQAGGGIRGGKSFTGALKAYIDYMWRRGHRGIKDDLWGFVAESYEMCQEEMRHLSRLFVEVGIEHNFHTPDGRPWSITFPDSACEFVTKSASDVTKIASRPYRGIVICEAAQTIEEALTNCQGRVSETRGWVLLEGTFESRKGPWYGLKANEWMKPGAEGVYYSLPSWENLVIFPGGRDDPEIRNREANMSPELFWERYGGMPSKRSDLVMRYAHEKYQIRYRFPNLKTSFDPDQPVLLFSDPGINHAYANFAVQPDGNTLWVIDAVYRWGRGAGEIIEECAAKPWARNVSMAVMDFAARQRRAEGPPIIEQWAKGWWKATGHQLSITTQPVPLQVGYDLHKRALLNTWPEEEADKTFNADKKMRQMVDPKGPKLYFTPEAAVPLFGGSVDGVMYGGEYNLHKQKKSRDGTITADDPIDTDNDGIKALNYGGYWYWSAGGDAWQWYASGESMPWSMEVA